MTSSSSYLSLCVLFLDFWESAHSINQQLDLRPLNDSCIGWMLVHARTRIVLIAFLLPLVQGHATLIDCAVRCVVLIIPGDGLARSSAYLMADIVPSQHHFVIRENVFVAVDIAIIKIADSFDDVGVDVVRVMIVVTTWWCV